MKSKKTLLLLLIGAAVILTVIWSTRNNAALTKPRILLATTTNSLVIPANARPEDVKISSTSSKAGKPIVQEQCPIIPNVKADIDTSDLYPNLNFNAKWIPQREYWSDAMEKRYHHRRKEMWPKVPLKVIVMPHSHNDPGWLKTYEGYFHASTKMILDNAVDKLTKYSNMTFIWTEISFLSMWWDSAHPARKQNLKKLVTEGRFEILTGGWVMTDEANVNLYAMVDQLVEGHQWILNTFGFKPKSSWSVDPFGHGSAFPYLLKSSGVDGMVIMRIHYAWKEWFAKEQSGDFMWRQVWDSKGKDAILCHNFPYDIYSIKGSCGPQSQTCLQFNFAVQPGSYSEYSGRTIPVTKSNIQDRSETILDQWGKTGSLFPHNVVLVPLGDDFTYTNDAEWDQQYSNYNQILEYINNNNYNAQVQWGTLSDYFAAVNSRIARFDNLVGDFFVYSDVFSEGVPAYWSGYYSTRPYMKKLSRELESSLRSSEIFYTWALNLARGIQNTAAISALEAVYAGIVKARRNLALFQHHDAITGTAKAFVTHDYGEKLFDGIIGTRNALKTSAQYILLQDRSLFQRKFLESDYERPDYGSREKPLSLDVKNGAQILVVLNSHGQDVDEMVSFFVENLDSRKNLCVRDPQGRVLPVQFSPTWTTEGFIRLEKSFLEVSFLARLPALSVTKFTVHLCNDKQDQFSDDSKIEPSPPTKVFCLRCPKNTKFSDDDPIILDKMNEGSVVISNAYLELIFDEDTHLLTSVKNKETNLTKNVKLTFGGYATMQFRNGAYLFKPDTSRDPLPVIDPIDNLKEIVIISGPVFSEISLIYEAGTTMANLGSFVHTVRLYHAHPDNPLARGIYIENNFSFGDQNNFRDLDMFMRLDSNLKNGPNQEWFSDSNGLSMQRRIPAVNASGLEGNIYPITNMIYLEDDTSRLTLLVDHATGASSQLQGRLEVIVDRRASYDDARGMGEGILDNRDTEHRYWLLLEPTISPTFDVVSVPTQLSSILSRRLNFPILHFVSSDSVTKGSLKSQARALEVPLPESLHLFNLRTNSVTTDKPGKTALMILHRQGFDCQYNGKDTIEDYVPKFDDDEVHIDKYQMTSLTGNDNQSANGSLNSLRKSGWRPENMRLQTLKLFFH